MSPAPKLGGKPLAFMNRTYCSEEDGNTIRRKMTSDCFNFRADLKSVNLTSSEKLKKLVQFVLRAGVKMVVSDWDLTALKVHSRGMVPADQIEFLANNISEQWIQMINSMSDNGVPLCVATFSDSYTVECCMNNPPNRIMRAGKAAVEEYRQELGGLITGEEVITKTLDLYNGAEGKRNIEVLDIVAKYPVNYQIREAYNRVGLDKPMHHSKRFHIQSMLDKFNLDSDEIILIDDDFANVVGAVQDGHYAVWVLEEEGFKITSVDVFEPYSIIDVVHRDVNAKDQLQRING